MARAAKGRIYYLWVGLALAPCLMPHAVLASGEPDAFALVGMGARAGGMGGAVAGLADEVETLYYNPAGLGNLVDSAATAMYQAPSLQTSRSFLAANMRWVSPKLPGSVALGWLRLRSSDIELTSSDEQVLGADTLTNDLVMLGAGVHPWPHWSMGAMMKYVRFAFNGFHESAFGFDVGAHAQYNPLRLGISLSDIGGTLMKGNSISAGAADAHDRIPMRLRTGAALVFPEPFNWPIHINLDWDQLFKLQDAQDSQAYFGGEIWGFQGRGAFRAGYQEGNGPTMGFGARWGHLQIDYAFLISNNLKDEHRLGTSVHF